MSGETDGHTLLLGDQALLHEHQVVTRELDDEMAQQAARGATPVLRRSTVKPPRCSPFVTRCAAIALPRCSACTAKAIVW
ncbi:hypothetical protein ACLK1Y_02690 [Escherichia coli]